MDAHGFRHHPHHQHPVTSFDDVMDLCVVDEDMMKQEPRGSIGGVSPQPEPSGGVSPLPLPVTTSTTTIGGDDQAGGPFVTFRLAAL